MDGVSVSITLRARVIWQFVRVGWHLVRLYPLRNVIFGIGLIVQLLVPLSLWHALLALRAESTYREFVTYTLTAVLVTELTFSSLVLTIGTRLDQGTMASFFVRPLGALELFLIQDVVQGGIAFFAPLVLVVGAAAVIFRHDLIPVTLAVAVQGLVALALAVLLRRAINTLAAAWFVRTGRGWGMSYILGLMVTGLSGGLFPAILLPRWLLRVITVLPFSAFANTPALIMTHLIAHPWHLLTLDGVWCVVFWGAAFAAWRGATRDLASYGG
jgi:ABC-type uncharacterized transport system permease subunit